MSEKWRDKVGKLLEEAREQLGRLEAAEAYPVKLGRAYASLREVDQDFEAYQKLGEEDWRRFGPSVEFRYGITYDPAPLRTDLRYEELIRRANQAWGLNRDGSLPEDTDVSIAPRPDA